MSTIHSLKVWGAVQKSCFVRGEDDKASKKERNCCALAGPMNLATHQIMPIQILSACYLKIDKLALKWPCLSLTCRKAAAESN